MINDNVSDNDNMNSQVNMIDVHKRRKGKYVIKLFGRWRHQSQFTTTETPNMSDSDNRRHNDNANESNSEQYSIGL